MTFKTPDQTKNMIIKKPNGSISIYVLDNLSGKTPITTREPSSGGIGMRLKTPSITLINIKFSKTALINEECGKNLNNILKIIANIKFAKGPLKPIQITSLFGFLNAQ